MLLNFLSGVTAIRYTELGLRVLHFENKYLLLTINLTAPFGSSYLIYINYIVYEFNFVVQNKSTELC